MCKKSPTIREPNSIASLETNLTEFLPKSGSFEPSVTLSTLITALPVYYEILNKH